MTPHHPIRCFPISKSPAIPVGNWFQTWSVQYSTSDWELPTRQQEALANLLPLLACGEQSAALVFNQESRRMSQLADREGAQIFAEIEAEELVHDQALQTLLDHMPSSSEQTRVKRRAQLFYARLGTHKTAQELFSGIYHLDSSVCQIMYHVANSDLPRAHPLVALFNRIKIDEASHVHISKKHLRRMGVALKDSRPAGRKIRSQLSALLEPESQYFESLGVDTARMLDAITQANKHYG